MKHFWFAAILLAACQTKTDRIALQAAESSAAVATASSTTAAPNSGPIVGNTSAALVTTAWTDTKHVMDTSLDAPNFQCAPKVFTQKDTLILRAEVPHGGWLIVARPDSTIFNLIAPNFGEPQPYDPLVQPETFKNTLILRFRADIRSRPQVYGRDTLEQVFRMPGQYVFTIGENLATEYDEEDPNWHCTVRFATSP